MPPQQPLTLAVFVPGIMGSALRVPGGESRWDDDLWLLVRSLARIGDLLGPLEPTRPLGRVALAGKEFFPGYEKALSALRQMDYRSLGDGAGDRRFLLPWPYDWRRGIDALGDELAKELRKRREEGFQRFLIVAHSMGCLVSRRALDAQFASGTEGEALKRTRLVEYAPPHRGSPSAIKALYGDPLDAFGFAPAASRALLSLCVPGSGTLLWLARLQYQAALHNGRRAAASFPSVFALMPPDDDYVVESDPAGNRFTTAEFLEPNGDRPNLAEELPKREILRIRAGDVNRALDGVWRVLMSRPDSTPHTLLAKKNWQNLWKLTGGEDRGDGDEVVPEDSATRWVDSAKVVRVFDRGYRHNSLPSAPAGLDVLREAASW